MKDVILYGDCRETLAQFDEKARCCVTSPPYYGLRNYGENKQIGLEQTPEEYIQQLVEVFRLVRDILTEDGTLWLNIGDSYAGANGNGNWEQALGQRKFKSFNSPTGGSVEGVKSKDLIGIPWMLAFALRADGWYLRQDIIWHKPNPMPESVQDRCTKSHEYIFLLSKNKHYYYDNEAIKEAAQDWGTRDRTHGKYHNKGSGLQPHTGLSQSYEKRNKRSVWTVNTTPFVGAHFAVFPKELITPCVLAGSTEGDIVLDPFMGSGTTANVAQSLNRHFIGCELNEDYEPLIKERTAQPNLI
tara:strand:+ start:70 stop:969 length:900 start_codon:yes stop_codon:yes gene_type:complete